MILNRRTVGVGAAAVAAMLMATTMAGCGGGGQSVDDVPLGAEVAVTNKEGVVVQGKLGDRTDTQVTVVQGRRTRVVPKADIADARIVTPGAPLDLPAIAKFSEYTVAEGTKMTIALGTDVDTAKNQAGDAVDASVADPVMTTAEGVIGLPSGSVVKGRVAALQRPGKVKGVAAFTLELTSVVARGETYAISARYEAAAPSEKKKDAGKIGIGAGAGAIIGGLAGGGKGAAIGAAIGGGAGTALVLSKAGTDISLPAGSKITVTLTKAIEVKVPIR